MPACKTCKFYHPAKDESDVAECENPTNAQFDESNPSGQFLQPPNPDWYCAYFLELSKSAEERLITLLNPVIETDGDGTTWYSFPFGKFAKGMFKPDANPFEFPAAMLHAMQLLTYFKQLTNRGIYVEATTPLGFWEIGDRSTGLKESVGAKDAPKRITAIVLAEIENWQRAKG